MANIYTLKSGLASDVTVWSSGTVPVSGDRVFIKVGHTVTLDGTYEWGDDSTATITISATSTTASIYVQGTLKASRSISSQLTCVGECQIVFSGSLDYGTEADPIPAAINAVIVINKSAVMAHGKYNLSTSSTLQWSGFRMWGSNKTPKSTMLAAIATDTSFTIADVAGWKIGDVLVFGCTTATASTAGLVPRTITTIVGNVVTVGANLGYNSQAGRSVYNITRNVRVVAYQGVSYRAAVYIQVPSNVSANSLEIGCCEINLPGSSAPICGLSINYASASYAISVVKRIYRPVIHDIISVVGSVITLSNSCLQGMLGLYGNQAATYTVEEPLISSFLSSAAICWLNGSSSIVLNPLMARVGTALSTNYSQGSVGAVVDGGIIEGASRSIVGNAVGFRMISAQFLGINQLIDGGAIALGSILIESCTLGGAFGIYTAPALSGATGGYVLATFLNCTMGALSLTRANSNLSNLKTDSFFFFKNLNNDVTSQLMYKKGGRIIRDNAFFKNSLSSLAMYSWYSTAALTHTQTVKISANATIRILGYCQFNTVYGTGTPPTLTITGLGIAPIVFTCPAIADQWHLIDLTITNPQTYPGLLTLSFAALSAANTETATTWFSGIPVDDFVTWTRHYGSLFDPSNPVCTANPIVVLSEAAAAALTGISFTSGTLTISSPHSIREVYDWMQWYECSNRLDPILTSTDGVNFVLAANLVLSSSLTGSGSISMPAYTLTNTGSSSVGITHNAGVLTTIAVSGLVAGSRIQIMDMSSLTELYNGVPGASFLQNVNWSVNKILRLRVIYASGAVAKLPLETTGILSSSGASFLVSQVADTVYNSLAIDGSTCTEFTPDYPNLQMDLSDSDGITSVQRLYAWAVWNQTTASGISLMFDSISAQDTANYIINVSVVNIKLDNIRSTPVILTGGYLSRSDGSTVIAATSGSIQMDPGRAFIAPGSATPADVWSYATRTLSDVPLIPTAEEIRTEMDTHSTKLLSIQTKVDELNNGPTAEEIRTEMDTHSTKLLSIQTKVDELNNGPTSEEIATQVRAEIETELAHLMTLENNPGLTPTQATMLLEIYRLYGLDPSKPLVVTQTTRSVTGAGIIQSITSGAIQTTIVRNQ